MNDISFPVVRGNSTRWPYKPVCPVCGENNIFEPHSFVVLSAGASLMDRDQDTGDSSEDLDGFLRMTMEGQGADQGEGCSLDIIRDSHGGQGDLYFCSTQCLRSFLNRAVDELESKVENV